jgi:membrane-bound lytic murein transglycosylase D
MAPRSNLTRHQANAGMFTSLCRVIVWLSFIVVASLIASSSNLDARTEPGMEADVADVDSMLGTSKSLSGETVLTPLNRASMSTYHDHTQDLLDHGDAFFITVPDHPAVKKYLRFYQREGRETIVSALESSWAHVPQMAEILKSYEVPSELVYMVLVESRFRNNALSPKGAAGCWQLMPATARRLGLRVNKAMDERYDPVKSTHAAAKYLRSLYAEFNSWPLAIAAYNSGGSPVAKAVRRHRQEDVWELAGRGALPGQTSAFVAKVFATISIVRDLESFGFERPHFLPIDTADLVWVHRTVSLHHVAQWVGSSVQELRTLNPALRSDHVPSGDEAFCLRLPAQTSQRFKLSYQKFLGKDSDG